MTDTHITAAMETPLCTIADAGINIVPALFARFFTSFPEQRAAFINFEAAAGRMTNETLEAMIGLATNQHWVPTTIINFVDLHRNYGDFPASLYAAFVDMAVDVLAEAAGDAWSEASDIAWRTQATRLNSMIAQAVIPTS
jgi:hemoglobin-like flavoprotein